MLILRIIPESVLQRCSRSANCQVTHVFLHGHSLSPSPPTYEHGLLHLWKALVYVCVLRWKKSERSTILKESHELLGSECCGRRRFTNSCDTKEHGTKHRWGAMISFRVERAGYKYTSRSSSSKAAFWMLSRRSRRVVTFVPHAGLQPVSYTAIFHASKARTACRAL